MQFRKRNYLYSLITLSTFFLYILVSNTKVYSDSSHVDSINKSLERLEKQFQSGNYKAICEESSQSANKIKIHLKSLKKKEPYYDWIEIREVLLNISVENCNKADK